MRRIKILSWIVYLAGVFLLCTITDTFGEFVVLILGASFAITGNRLINENKQ